MNKAPQDVEVLDGPLFSSFKKSGMSLLSSLCEVNFFNTGVLRTEIRFLEIQDGKDVDVLRRPVHKPKKFSVISQMMINIFHQK